jgi:hypothetical protein
VSFGLGVASAMLALCATGRIGWRRSSVLRRGAIVPRTGEHPWRTRTSPTTWLAAAAGACGAGLAATSDWAAPTRIAGLAAAGFVLVSGLAARVTGFDEEPDGVVVRRAALPDRAARAVRVGEVIPPRWPLGAWRIVGDGPPISLMPSDLLGSEAALARLVNDAGLRFDGRRWRRPGADG